MTTQLSHAITASPLKRATQTLQSEPSNEAVSNTASQPAMKAANETPLPQQEKSSHEMDENTPLALTNSNETATHYLNTLNLNTLAENATFPLTNEHLLFGAQLNYSMSSLQRIDKLIDQLKRHQNTEFSDYKENDAKHNFLLILAFYIGEMAAKYKRTHADWYTPKQFAQSFPSEPEPAHTFSNQFIAVINQQRFKPIDFLLRRLFRDDKETLSTYLKQHLNQDNHVKLVAAETPQHKSDVLHTADPDHVLSHTAKTLEPQQEKQPIEASQDSQLMPQHDSQLRSEKQHDKQIPLAKNTQTSSQNASSHTVNMQVDCNPEETLTKDTASITTQKTAQQPPPLQAVAHQAKSSAKAVADITSQTAQTALQKPLMQPQLQNNTQALSKQNEPKPSMLKSNSVFEDHGLTQHSNADEVISNQHTNPDLSATTHSETEKPMRVTQDVSKLITTFKPPVLPSVLLSLPCFGLFAYTLYRMLMTDAGFSTGNIIMAVLFGVLLLAVWVNFAMSNISVFNNKVTATSLIKNKAAIFDNETRFFHLPAAADSGFVKWFGKPASTQILTGQDTLSVSAQNHDGLEDLLLEIETDLLLDTTLKRLNNGETILFGQLQLTKDNLTNGKKTIAIHNITDYDLDDNDFIITGANGTTFARIAITGQPNINTLVTAIEHLQDA